MNSRLDIQEKVQVRLKKKSEVGKMPNGVTDIIWHVSTKTSKIVFIDIHGLYLTMSTCPPLLSIKACLKWEGFAELSLGLRLLPVTYRPHQSSCSRATVENVYFAQFFHVSHGILEVKPSLLILVNVS